MNKHATNCGADATESQDVTHVMAYASRGSLMLDKCTINFICEKTNP